MDNGPPPPGERLSAAELKAKSQGEDAWACPRCGCRDWRVVNSYPCKDGTRHRTLSCRHCHHTRQTVEAPVGEA